MEFEQQTAAAEASSLPPMSSELAETTKPKSSEAASARRRALIARLAADLPPPRLSSADSSGFVNLSPGKRPDAAGAVVDPDAKAKEELMRRFERHAAVPNNPPPRLMQSHSRDYKVPIMRLESTDDSEGPGQVLHAKTEVIVYHQAADRDADPSNCDRRAWERLRAGLLTKMCENQRRGLEERQRRYAEYAREQGYTIDSSGCLVKPGDEEKALARRKKKMQSKSQDLSDEDAEDSEVDEEYKPASRDSGGSGSDEDSEEDGDEETDGGEGEDEILEEEGDEDGGDEKGEKATAEAAVAVACPMSQVDLFASTNTNTNTGQAAATDATFFVSQSDSQLSEVPCGGQRMPSQLPDTQEATQYRQQEASSDNWFGTQESQEPLIQSQLHFSGVSGVSGIGDCAVPTAAAAAAGLGDGFDSTPSGGFSQFLTPPQSDPTAAAAAAAAFPDFITQAPLVVGPPPDAKAKARAKAVVDLDDKSNGEGDGDIEGDSEDEDLAEALMRGVRGCKDGDKAVPEKPSSSPQPKEPAGEDKGEGESDGDSEDSDTDSTDEVNDSDDDDESDDDEDEVSNEGASKSRKTKRRFFVESEGEGEEEEDEEENSEGEKPKESPRKARKLLRQQDFLEEEAELSGSDVGEGDGEGDDEEIDRALAAELEGMIDDDEEALGGRSHLRKQVARIGHAIDLDEDRRQIDRLKELLLPDGEYADEGEGEGEVARKWRFNRWKELLERRETAEEAAAPAWEDGDAAQRLRDEEEQEAEAAAEQALRIERHKREQYLEQQQQLHDQQQSQQHRPSLLEDSVSQQSQFFRDMQARVLRESSNSGLATSGFMRPPPTVPSALPVKQPVPKQHVEEPQQQQQAAATANKRKNFAPVKRAGSFLKRGRDSSAGLRQLVAKTGGPSGGSELKASVKAEAASAGGSKHVAVFSVHSRKQQQQQQQQQKQQQKQTSAVHSAEAATRKRASGSPALAVGPAAKRARDCGGASTAARPTLLSSICANDGFGEGGKAK